MKEPVYVEAGKRWSYAGALGWPGWCRHGKTADAAIEALAAYGPRYQAALALGSRSPKVAVDDRAALLAAIRGRAMDTFVARSTDSAIADPGRVERRWWPRFYVSHTAWHALHHAWEIEDRVI